MYVPAHFREDSLPVLHEAIRRTRLASLVTFGAGGLEASHVPVLLDPEDGERGALTGHVARANPQWRLADPAVPALAIFLGPDAYVSPSWYPSKRATGKVVPTWNYVAVHAYGTLEVFDEPARLRVLVDALTDRHEAVRAAPWRVADAPPDYVDAMLAGIVGFRLAITRLEGKWKLGQNRTREDRDGVVRGLDAGDEREQTIARLMREAVPQTTA
jgi:transcriptional regulator